MGVVDSDGDRTIEPGTFTLSVGRSATDPRARQVEFTVE
jgi:hypothetical protein